MRAYGGTRLPLTRAYRSSGARHILVENGTGFELLICEAKGHQTGQNSKRPHMRFMASAADRRHTTLTHPLLRNRTTALLQLIGTLSDCVLARRCIGDAVCIRPVWVKPNSRARAERQAQLGLSSRPIWAGLS